MIDKKSFALGLAVGGRWNLLRLPGGSLMSARRIGAQKHPHSARAAATRCSVKPQGRVSAEGWLYKGQAKERGVSLSVRVAPPPVRPQAAGTMETYGHSVYSCGIAAAIAAGVEARVTHYEMENDIYA